MKPKHTVLFFLVLLSPGTLFADEEGQGEPGLDAEFLRFLMEFEDNDEWVDPTAVEAVMNKRKMEPSETQDLPHQTTMEDK